MESSEVQWLIHSVQYANPTAIYKGEPAEPVQLSSAAYDGQIVILRWHCLQCLRGITN